MQEKSTEFKNKLREAYNRIVNEGKSLREVSRELGIERRRLKKLIEEELIPEELVKFKEVIGNKNYRNKVAKENGEHKKNRALEAEEYKNVIKELSQRGVQLETIETIYNRCQERPQTKVAKDTLVIKLIELLDYFETRNENIQEESEGYISANDLVQMILRNPRMINSDIKSNIIAKCAVITRKSKGDIIVANAKIKGNPGIFRKTVESIEKGK